MTFAKWVFTGAGVYGLIVLPPLYFLQDAMVAQGGPITYPEHFYGFVGTAIAFQLVFLVVGRDPTRYRPLMLCGVVEKLSFGLPVWFLFSRGQVEPPIVLFGTIDLLLGLLFAISWLRTRPQPS